MKKEKAFKLLSYLILTIITACCFFAFKEFVVLNGSSFEPIFVIIIMLWSATVFNDKDFIIGSNFATDLAEEERIKLGKCISDSYTYLASLLIPTIFFFENWFKIAFPLVLVFLGVLLGSLIFRIKYSKQIKERIAKEEKELKEQIDSELQGKNK